jgi:ATP-dependent protease ClpP protease subunit
MPKPFKPMFRAKTRMSASQNTTLELLVYDQIGEDYWSGGGVTAKSVAQAIKDAGVFDRISVRVNSPGGSAFEGVAIYNLLRAQAKPIDVYVDGLAASAASVIAMAGDTIYVGLGAMIMVHNAATFAYGDGPLLRQVADTLDNISLTIGGIYVAKTGQSVEEIKTLMDAETWMGAQDAVDKGFATKLMNQDEETTTQARALVNSFNLRHCKHVPDSIKPAACATNDAGACECECDPCQTGDCSKCANADCVDPNCDGCPNQMEAENQAPADAFDDVARQRLTLYERTS